jgi:hypothetical protein
MALPTGATDHHPVCVYCEPGKCNFDSRTQCTVSLRHQDDSPLCRQDYHLVTRSVYDSDSNLLVT